MINFIKNLTAFIIGMAFMLFCYYKVSIPIICSGAIYATSLLFYNNQIKSRIIFVVLGVTISVYFYSADIIASIVNYPKYLNVLGIIFEFLNIFSILGAGIILLKELMFNANQKVKNFYYDNKENI